MHLSEELERLAQRQQSTGGGSLLPVDADGGESAAILGVQRQATEDLQAELTESHE